MGRIPTKDLRQAEAFNTFWCWRGHWERELRVSIRASGNNTSNDLHAKIHRNGIHPVSDRADPDSPHQRPMRWARFGSPAEHDESASFSVPAYPDHSNATSHEGASVGIARLTQSCTPPR